MQISSVDEVIANFATCGSTFPHLAARWALDNWHEAGPRFEQMIEHFAAGIDRSESTTRALFFVVHLLAERNESGAFPALCRIAADEVLCRDVFGDGVTETLRGVLISTSNGNAASLKELIESPTADQFARAAALDALAYLTRKGEFDDEETHAYLRRLAETMQPRGPSCLGAHCGRPWLRRPP